MCGIAGLFPNHFSPKTGSMAQAVSAKMQHRGPNDEGFVLLRRDGSFTLLAGADTPTDVTDYHSLQSLKEADFSAESLGILIHRRLSILDLSPAGHQPMRSNNARWIMVYNGEIYNFRELASQYGIRLQSQCDSELFLELWAAVGPECLKVCNGMFAAAFWDTKELTLHLVRDSLGVKPVYYLQNSSGFYFGSEPKLIWPFSSRHVLPDNGLIWDFITRSRLEFEESGWYSEVQELKPGMHLQFEYASQSIKKRYWADGIPLEKTKSLLDWTSGVKEKVETSVKRRLLSDVPLAISLSGGLDSAVIASVAARHHPNLVSFTAEFPNFPESEWKFVEQIQDKSGFIAKKVLLSPDDFDRELQEVVAAQDLPLVHSSTLAQFRVMKMAAEQGFKVILDGQGGDELFGGYPQQIAIAFIHACKTQPSFTFEILRNRRHLPMPVRFLLDFTLKHLGAKLGVKPQYPQLAELWGSEKPAFQNWDTYEVPGSMRDFSWSFLKGNAFKNLVRWADRNGMAHSIESRFPLADDIDLLDFAFQIPDAIKLHQAWSKYLLRAAFSPFLPESVAWRKEKQPYSTPESAWMMNRRQIQQNWHPDMACWFSLEKLNKAMASGSLSASYSFKLMTLNAWLHHRSQLLSDWSF